MDMTTHDGDGYWLLIEPIWDRVRISDGPRAFLEQFRGLSVPQQHLLASHWCHSEVCNGGFHQFFMNPTGVLSPEAADAFAVVGLLGASMVVREAMAFFGPLFPRDQGVRQAALDARRGRTRAEWDPFYTLDDRFYASVTTAGGYEVLADRYAVSVTRPAHP